jgi:hypothetical protein
MTVTIVLALATLGSMSHLGQHDTDRIISILLSCVSEGFANNLSKCKQSIRIISICVASPKVTKVSKTTEKSQTFSW